MTDFLEGIRVLEIGGIGPIPHAGMILASHGADVVRVERAGGRAEDRRWDGTRRGRSVVYADLSSKSDRELVLALADRADVVLEGHRPGVADRMGVGPGAVRARNPRAVYGQMTGWGQDGPWAGMAGHDINYIGVTGALHATGAAEPMPPLNLVGDFGGGSTYLVIGVLSALVARERTGEGCVLDASIVDGTTSLMQLIWSLQGAGRWQDQRQQNFLDGGAPHYRTYECADGGWMAVGALEPQFYALFLAGLGIDGEAIPDRSDPSQWPALAAIFAAAFGQHPRRHWEAVFDGTDACVTPVLSMSEVAGHPHLSARGTLVPSDDGSLAATAPRVVGATATTLPPSSDSTLPRQIERWRLIP